MKITKRNRLTARTAFVTFFIIACGIIAAVLMGRVVSVVEGNAFGRQVTVFAVPNDREFIIFGKTFDFPIIAVFKRIGTYIRRYAPGIIKLLGFAVNAVKELIENIIYSIVSSLK